MSQGIPDWIKGQNILADIYRAADRELKKPNPQLPLRSLITGPTLTVDNTSKDNKAEIQEP